MSTMINVLSFLFVLLLIITLTAMFTFIWQISKIRTDLKEFTTAINKLFTSDKLLEHRVAELEMNRQNARDRFSMILDAITKTNIEVAGLKSTLVTKEQIDDLKEFYENKLKYMNK